MWTSFCNWWTSNGTYTSIRNIAELFYFIVLTGAMVYYAAKTYKKSVEAKPELNDKSKEIARGKNYLISKDVDSWLDEVLT